MENAEKFLTIVDSFYQDSICFIKQHPDEVYGDARSELEKRIIGLNSKIIFLDPSSDNGVSRDVMSICDAVFVQSFSSSVVALAVLLNVPVIRYDFFSTGAKTSVDEWFKLNSKSYIKKITKTKCTSFVTLEKIN